MSEFTIYLILILIVAFLLIVAIMVQNPKGGGLSSSFGGSGTQQVGGVKQTSDFLDKSTWFLATLLLVLILLSNVTIMNNGATDTKILDGNSPQQEQPQQTIPEAPDQTENNTPAKSNNGQSEE
ncbi:MAG: preprotein translocase subunit SecG [Psychroflexus sp.]|jgi:preprotein translocase subunit SecG|nr:preprotein translocase subunit SecG [Psychroflexus sp.]MDR9448489.1 preprotein translocase subunit SecG [Psychroflexus sp.]